MSLLDVDKLIDSNISILMNALSDKENYTDHNNYIYNMIDSMYPMISTSDELFDLGIGFYIVLYFRSGYVYKVSIIGIDEIIDIGYDIYINNNTWDIMINPKRHIQKSGKYIIYEIDENIYNNLKIFFKDKIK